MNKKRKRDKRFGLSRETIREMTTPEELQQVAGGQVEEVATCIPGGTTHCTNLC